MNKIKDNFASIKVIFFFILVISIVVIPVVMYNYKEENEKNFPKYQDIDITEENLSNENSYNNIRYQLESDVYFAKVATMMDYSSENYSSADLRELLWYYIFNYEISNDDYFFHKESDRGVYCISEKNLIKGFKELYDIDISNDTYLLPGYFEYIFKKDNGYCLYFNNVAEEYTNDVKIAVERMSMYGTTVTTDVYVYEYYNDYSDNANKYISYLEGYIKNKDYDTCNKIVNEHLNGTITHKQLKIKVNSNGKFFKYKIISSKKLDY